MELLVSVARLPGSVVVRFLRKRIRAIVAPTKATPTRSSKSPRQILLPTKKDRPLLEGSFGFD
ncbi:hypothetical protein [Bdellovibrio sp. HCB2-146]|uniref:hypothetical protein n=1 Tax=Bdellovibrio sp. HCB2-146 TaxID=3394362 RepID=UPI0039BCB9DB